MWISSYHFPHLLISNIGKTQEEYFVFTAAMSRQLKKCKELLSFDLVHKSLEENQQKEKGELEKAMGFFRQELATCPISLPLVPSLLAIMVTRV